MSEHTNVLSRRTFLFGSAAVAAALATTNPVSAFAVTAAEKKAEAAAALSKLEALEDRLAAASTDFVNAEAVQREAKNKMDEAQNNIDSATDKIADLQEQLGTRARSMYRTGSTSVLDLLLGSTSFQAFTNNWTLLNGMNANDAEMVQQTKELRANVEEQKEVYTQQEALAAENVKIAAAAEKEAESLVNEMQSTYNTLSAEAQALFDKEQEARIAAREAAEAAARAAATTKKNSSSSKSSNSGNNGGENKTSTSSSKGTSNAPQGGTGSAAVAAAATQLGVPYRLGDGRPYKGWDCSHLVCWALGITYHTADTLGGMYPVAANPMPGDIVHRQGHVGIYVGGDQMIHAPKPGDVVKYGSIYTPGKTTRILRVC